MILNKVDIVNFRSIKEIEIIFDNNCKILAGKNESGKSNILKALSYLSNEPFKYEDIRESLPDEEPIKSSHITFFFKLNKEQIAHVCNSVTKYFTEFDNDSEVFLEKNYALSKFCEERCELGGVYTVDLLAQTRMAKYWLLPKESQNKLTSLWKYKDYKFSSSVENLKDKKNLIYSNMPQLGESILVSYEDINMIVGNEIGKTVQSNLPEIIFWTYEEKNLLPSSINIAEFIKNPGSCLPLKNMFLMAGITNISSELEKTLNEPFNRLKNLLEKVANQSTKHFHSIWNEYKNICFSLTPNGSFIDAGIKEKNTYPFSSRSDGFKRFISFLLLISLQVKNKKLANKIILIDEPESSLHPSGVRYLRDELIKISENNYVVITTHSISMIDPLKIDRHYIVKKESEITSIQIPDEANLAEEEVIFGAMGFSIHEFLSHNNIIFEGWRDKKLFKTALEKIPSEHKDIKDEFNKIGICHADGVKNLKNITPVLELSRKKCLIISDCDTSALSIRKDYKKDNGYGEWKTYKEIDDTISAIIGEDFLKTDYIEKALNSLLKEKYSSTDNISLTDTPNILNHIENVLKTKGYEKNIIDKLKPDLKTRLFENIKPTNIKDSYYSFLKKIIQEIGKK